MYTIHGGKNGNYVPLGFALLPLKTENCYTRMWNLLISKCRELKLTISPEHTHIDFELAMHNSLRTVFPSAKIDCCRFHMGQSLWRKIQSVGLSTQYKDKTTDIGKWLTMFFGLPILPSNEVEDCFVEDVMSVAPTDSKCHQFSDYILETYISSTAKFRPEMWSAVPCAELKRTTNGPESFHSNFIQHIQQYLHLLTSY